MDAAYVEARREGRQLVNIEHRREAKMRRDERNILESRKTLNDIKEFIKNERKNRNNWATSAISGQHADRP
jgi:hypothetical protein